MSTPDDNGEQREVLSSLPRSRRQRPSARREAARAGRATPAKPKAAAKPKATATAAKAKAAPKAKPAPKPRKRTAPVAQARSKSATKQSVIPPAGYATPREGSGRGSADPGAALVGLMRGIRGLFPF